MQDHRYPPTVDPYAGRPAAEHARRELELEPTTYLARHEAPDVIESGTARWRRLQYANRGGWTRDDIWLWTLGIAAAATFGGAIGWGIYHAIEVMTR